MSVNPIILIYIYIYFFIYLGTLPGRLYNMRQKYKQTQLIRALATLNISNYTATQQI